MNRGVRSDSGLFASLRRLLGLSPTPALRGQRGTGQRGEREAEKHLRRLGYEIIARNWRGAGGEVDLIAREGEATVFVEVKSGAAGGKLPPQVHVSRDKQRQLLRLVEAYGKQNGLLGHAVRIDVVEVLWGSGGEVAEVRHHVGAVNAGRGYGERR